MSKNDEKNFIIGLVFTVVLTFFCACGALGYGICSTRKYRAQLEECARLEQQIRTQSELIRRTSADLGELIQSTDRELSEGITTVGELRKTMQILENNYNNMHERLVDIYSNFDSVDDNGELK